MPSNKMGASHFLLVGDDIIDYHNYLYADAVSFIPSLYAEAYPGQRFMPVDSLYTDIGENMSMEAAIPGYFPAKTRSRSDANDSEDACLFQSRAYSAIHSRFS